MITSLKLTGDIHSNCYAESDKEWSVEVTEGTLASHTSLFRAWDIEDTLLDISVLIKDNIPILLCHDSVVEVRKSAQTNCGRNMWSLHVDNIFIRKYVNVSSAGKKAQLFLEIRKELVKNKKHPNGVNLPKSDKELS